jgi:putative transposase
MKRSRFTDEQIIGALKRLDGGVAAKDVSRDLGVNVQTLYRWRKKFGGMDVNEARRLKQLEEENRRLKRLVADLTLDKQMLQDVASRKW